MPNRIIRDALKTSPRYWSCTPLARNLYLSILLSADDLGRCPGNVFFLRTHCLAGTVKERDVPKLLAQLVAHDLVRPYEVDQVSYVFVPRFRQFVRYSRSHYAAPPAEISDIPEKKQCPSTAQAPPKQRLGAAQASRSEVKRREVNNFSVETTSLQVGTKRADVPFQQIVDLYHAMLPELPAVVKLTAARKAQIRARWSGHDADELADWKQYFELVRKSAFLLGLAAPMNGRKAFRADLDWLTKEANFTKVIEGKYA